MAAGFGDVGEWDKLPKEFLDEALSTDGGVSEEKLKEEKGSTPDKSTLAKILLDEPYEPSECDSNSSESVGPKPEAEDKSALPKDPIELVDEADAEKLTLIWIQAKAAGKSPKVHLPHPSSVVDGKAVGNTPKCGASGSFDVIKAEETLDAAARLCRRCCPSTEMSKGCEAICGHMYLGRNVSVYRCIRRCEGTESDGHVDHRCAFHAQGPKREGPKND